MTLRHTFAIALSSLAFTLSLPIAHAAEWDGCFRWAGDSVTMRANIFQFGSGSGADLLDRILDAEEAWAATATDFEYHITLDNDFASTVGNGESEIFFSNATPPEALAAVFNYKHPFLCFYVESDLVIAPGADFSSSSSKSNLGAYQGDGSQLFSVDEDISFVSTMIHELGHVQGLQHEDDEYNCMMPSLQPMFHTNGSTARAYVGEDAAQISRLMYGDKNVSSPFGMRDFAVSHWKFNPATSTAQHTRTGVFSGGGSVGASMVNGEPVFNVTAGIPIEVEFTVESIGNFTNPFEQVEVRLYLSTNSFISKYDTFLGSSTVFTGSTGFAAPHRFTVTLPTSMPVGQIRYVGAIVNPTGLSTEVLTNNNATYTAVRR